MGFNSVFKGLSPLWIRLQLPSPSYGSEWPPHATLPILPGHILTLLASNLKMDPAFSTYTTKWCHGKEYHNLKDNFSNGLLPADSQAAESLIIHPLLRCRISCSSGPQQHCTILMHRENFTFTDTLPCFQIVFYFALTKETDFKEIRTKCCPLNTSHSHQDHTDIEFHSCFTSTERFPYTQWIGGWLGPSTEKLL